MPPRVTLLTDFGTADGYVAAMKGVMAARVPGVQLDDVAHDLAQGDIVTASRTLGRYWHLYPEGSVHLVVVDPGVGTGRRALALECEGRLVVAPDNGVVSEVVRTGQAWRAVEIVHVRAPGAPSTTFHGRDVFAPAAAHLAAGGPLADLGPALEDPLLLERPEPERFASGGARGTALAVDRFGNVATNLPGDWLQGVRAVELSGRSLPVASTYGDVAPGEALVLVGSDGYVEIAVRDGSAADVLGLAPGSVVVLPN